MGYTDSIEQEFAEELKTIRSDYGGEELHIMKTKDDRGFLFTFYITGSHIQISDLQKYSPGITTDNGETILTLSDFAEWICGRGMKGFCEADSAKQKSSAKTFNGILKKSGLLLKDEEIEFVTFIFRPQKVCDILEIPYSDCRDMIVNTYNEIIANRAVV